MNLNYAPSGIQEVDIAMLLIFWIVFILVMIWALIWKGMALWTSCKRGDKSWFIVFLFVNTLGILEAIYLFAVAKILHPKKKNKPMKKRRKR